MKEEEETEETEEVKRLANIERNKQFLLEILIARDSVKRKKIIATCTEDQLNAVAEMLLNLINGTFYLSKNKRSTLTSSLKFAKKMTRKSISIKTRRELFKKYFSKFAGLLRLVLPVLLATLLHGAAGEDTADYTNGSGSGV